MSLMMDDNLAGSGNTITEVASVSRRRRTVPVLLHSAALNPHFKRLTRLLFPPGTGPRVPLVSLFRPPAGAT